MLSDVTGAHTETLLPAKPNELVTQLNDAATAHRTWPWVLLATFVLSGATTPWLLLPGVLVTILFSGWDSVRRTVATFYEVEGPAHRQYQDLLTQFQSVQQADSAWHIVAHGDVATTHQRKVNAGANSLVRRDALNRDLSGPKHMKSNISIPSLSSSQRAVYLLPDRILVRDKNSYVDISYRDITVNVSEQQFIESDKVPQDGHQVGTTWKYVNKNGGPDKRFNDNRQLPVMLYGYVTLTSATGLRVVWSFSNTGSAVTLAKALYAQKEGQ